jgi:anti-sigma-K factor RskA
MSEADDNKEVLAAEYVLGTLDADDRANARMLMAIDPEFAGNVALWERRFGELYALIDPVEPSPHNWDWIKARIAPIRPSGRIWMPSLNEAAAPARASAAEANAVLREPAKPTAKAPSTPPATREPAAKTSSSAGWRGLALLSLLAAFALAALGGLREMRPDLLPPALQPTPVIVEKPVEVLREVVREVPSQRFAEYVAVFQEGGAPSFLLSVDLARRLISVRRVAEKPAQGGAHQLWIMSPGEPAPRSLGLLDEATFTARPLPNGFDAPAIASATFGISLEPAGGSPSGAPTGALSRAQLLQTIPSAFPAVAP